MVRNVKGWNSFEKFQLDFKKMVANFLFTMICRFMMRKVRMKKYMSSIGQNIGTSNISKNVQNKANRVDFFVESLDGLKIN